MTEETPNAGRDDVKLNFQGGALAMPEHEFAPLKFIAENRKLAALATSDMSKPTFKNDLVRRFFGEMINRPAGRRQRQHQEQTKAEEAIAKKVADERKLSELTKLLIEALNRNSEVGAELIEALNRTCDPTAKLLEEFSE